MLLYINDWDDTVAVEFALLDLTAATEADVTGIAAVSDTTRS